MKNVTNVTDKLNQITIYFILNKKKYFRLRLSDEVGTERDLRQTYERKMKIQSFRQVFAGQTTLQQTHRQTDRKSDSLSSWRSQKIYAILSVILSILALLTGLTSEPPTILVSFISLVSLVLLSFATPHWHWGNVDAAFAGKIQSLMDGNLNNCFYWPGNASVVGAVVVVGLVTIVVVGAALVVDVIVGDAMMLLSRSWPIASSAVVGAIVEASNVEVVAGVTVGAAVGWNKPGRVPIPPGKNSLDCRPWSSFSVSSQSSAPT